MEASEETTLLEPASGVVAGGTTFTSGKDVEEEGSSSCDATVGTEEEEEGTQSEEPPDRCSDGSDSGLGPDDEGRSSNGKSFYEKKLQYVMYLIFIATVSVIKNYFTLLHAIYLMKYLFLTTD